MKKMNRYSKAYDNLHHLGLLTSKELEHIKLASMKEAIYKNGDLEKEKKKIVNKHIREYKFTYLIDFILYFPLFSILIIPFLLLMYHYLFIYFYDIPYIGFSLPWLFSYIFIYSFIEYSPFPIFKISRLFKNKLQLNEIQ
jgi:hypothetical protein